MGGKMSIQSQNAERAPGYSYADCLERSYRVNWTIKDVLGNQNFDKSRRWLPKALSGADQINCLGERERVKLTHLEMEAYAHIFGYVEEFIAPKMVILASSNWS